MENAITVCNACQEITAFENFLFYDTPQTFLGGGIPLIRVGGVASKTVTSGGEFLFKTWHKGTFINKTQSVMYHVSKHGNGRTAIEYTKDAMSFFNKNKRFGQSTILKDGTQGIKIQLKQLINGKTHRTGGYWTNDGKLVTFWD